MEERRRFKHRAAAVLQPPQAVLHMGLRPTQGPFLDGSNANPVLQCNPVPTCGDVSLVQALYNLLHQICQAGTVQGLALDHLRRAGRAAGGCEGSGALVLPRHPEDIKAEVRVRSLGDPAAGQVPPPFPHALPAPRRPSAPLGGPVRV